MVGDPQSIDNFLVPPRIRVRNQPSRLGWLVPFHPLLQARHHAPEIPPRTLETTWRNGPLPCATIRSTKQTNQRRVSSVSFGQAIVRVFSNYANFQGRARRSEYWYFVLFYGIVMLCLSLLALIPGAVLLTVIFWLGTVVPNLAVSWRRLHDTGRSGAWVFLSLVPLVGVLILILWMAEDSQPGTNPFGPNPKGAQAPAARHEGRNIPQRAAVQVHCINGPMQGQTFSLGPQGLWFGRDAACAVRFPDGTPGISRVHCRLGWDRGVPVLVDLNSRFGTFLVSGKQLPPNYPEAVSPGARFYLGNPGNLFQIIS